MFKYVTGTLGVAGLILGLIAYSLYKKDIENSVKISKLSSEVIILVQDLDRCHELKESQVGGCFDYIEGKNKLEGKYSDLIIEYNKTVSKLEDKEYAREVEVADNIGDGDKQLHNKNDIGGSGDIRVAAAKRLLCAASLAEEHLCSDSR